MSKVYKVCRSTEGMIQDFEDKIAELRGVAQSTEVTSNHDSCNCGRADCPTCNKNYVKGGSSESPEIFRSYADFLDAYSDYYDFEDLEQELAAVESEIASYGEDPQNCSVYWRDDYEKPIVEMEGRFYFADWRGGSEARLTPVDAVYDLQSLGLSDEVESCDSITSGYEIQDSYGAPQAGVDIKKFDEWYEVEEYLDQNPDVRDRIDEGYALIKECE